MKILLNLSQFDNVIAGKISLVVTFPSAGGSQDNFEDGIQIVLGHCNTCTVRDRETGVQEFCGIKFPDWQESLCTVVKLYPAGTMVAGMAVRLAENTDEKEREKQLKQFITALLKETDLKATFNNRQSILLLAVSGRGEAVSALAYEVDITSVSDVRLDTATVMTASGPNSISRHLSMYAVLLKVAATFPVYFTVPDIDADGIFLSLKEKLLSSSTMLLLPSVSYLLPGTAPDSKLSSILADRYKAVSKPSKSGSDQITSFMREDPVRVELLESAAYGGGSAGGDLPRGATVTVEEPVGGDCVAVHVPVDCVAMVSWDTSAADVVTLLKQGIIRQLDAIEDHLFWKPGVVHSVGTHHFVLENQNCPITIVYPDVPLSLSNLTPSTPSLPLTNRDLKPLREKWLDLLGIPRKSPCLRILTRHSKAWLGSCKLKVSGPQLRNPHLEVKNPKVRGGTVAMVKGDYLYYHYMQDGFDDNGWGCAYRSLQTLWSWFFLQGFTEKKVPSHRDMQMALVEVGDKNKSFVGSREWIGSFEVSTVLNQLLGVESKIHFCPGGNMMSIVGRVLVEHFQSQGTPVMIGGGVLAHTILGVNFNELTGEVEYLVLDPHYTGRDDIKPVVEKGWCAWKPVSFWESSAHYNMCLPQLSENL